MSTPNEQSGASSEAPAFTPAEQASIEVGQRGLSEPQNVNTITPPASDRPEWLPEKFVKDGKPDYEALARSYSELEKARSAPQTPAETPPETPEAAAAKPDGKIEKTQGEEGAEKPASNPLTAAMEAARNEYASTQEVSEDTVKALEEAGIPKEVFDLYLAGVKAQEQAALTSIHSFVDGAENYNAMAKWAGQALDEAELEAFNSALDNPQLRENAVRGLYARYSAARPSEGQMITPQGGTSEAGDVYSDRSQLTNDMKDPRYQTDSGFRQTVQDKLLRSQRSGFQLVARPMFERNIYSS
jgi:hypothetical protein